jgi:crotonobetainyl-CoA:carnitine CoA-transferase CaiB-like acyl-CoA transferase
VNPERAGIFVTGRSVMGAKMRVMWSCKDGWINFIIYGGSAGRHTNQQLVAWMDEKGMAPDWLKKNDWSSFAVTNITQKEVDRLEAPIAKFFSTLTKQDFVTGAVERQMLGYPVSTVEDIYKDEQLHAREFWQKVRPADSGVTLDFPGGFALFGNERPQIRVPAPRIGEHNKDIYENDLGLSSREVEHLRSENVI